MPVTAEVLSITAGAVALFLTGITSVPGIRSIVDRIGCRSLQHDESAIGKTAYRDEDGEASDETLQAFSDKWQRVVIAVFSASGFATTLALAVFTTLETNKSYTALNWLQLGIWVRVIDSGRREVH